MHCSPESVGNSRFTPAAVTQPIYLSTTYERGADGKYPRGSPIRVKTTPIDALWNIASPHIGKWQRSPDFSIRHAGSNCSCARPAFDIPVGVGEFSGTTQRGGRRTPAGACQGASSTGAIRRPIQASAPRLSVRSHSRRSNRFLLQERMLIWLWLADGTGHRGNKQKNRVP